MKWTDEQNQAIIKKDSNILVAAAAGSGKTAVLVERIIGKIINDNIDIDKILVVTFTNAAASEMRERILEALYKKIDLEPDNINLQKQIILLKKANICTIHSFCLEIIKNNFFEIDLTSNFKIASEEENELLKQEVLEKIFDLYYENEDEQFEKLLEMYTDYKDDIKLKEMILKIYNFIQSTPFPEDWLEDNILKFKTDINMDFSETMWGQILLNEFKDGLNICINILENLKNKLERCVELEKYYSVVLTDLNKLKNIKYIKDIKWDRLLDEVNQISFDRWPSDKKIENNLKEYAKNIRDSVKKKFEELRQKTFGITSKEALEDLNKMYTILNTLKNIILEFDIEFKKIKNQKNIIDFHDIEHYALKILVNKKENEYVPTDVALRYREKFAEIAVDEYQDSNQIQEYILSTVSNGKNMFMVGDVKQSIYKFRQACPELFLEKYSKFDLGIANENGLKIQLFKNFRSRENILNITNIIFETIMTKSLGEMDYTAEEFLNLGVNYESVNQKSEICVIDMKDENTDEILQENEEIENFEKEELEANFVADKIRKLVENKVQVIDKKTGCFRDIKYKDIVILLRKTSNIAQIFEKALLEKNVPVYSESSSKYLETMEISSIINFLKIIDNPENDIALVSVLRSPFYRFKDNELIEIRLENRDKSFYQSLLNYNKEDKLKNKILDFLIQMEEFRNFSEHLLISELIWKIYNKTGFYQFVSLMPNGNIKQANLKMLFERAKEFEKSNLKGLYNFIKYLENLKDNNKDLSAAKIIGENEDVVRIMSIHKSKGLEFPYVFLSNANKKFNLRDLSESILLHQKIGFGTEYIDYERKIQYPTVSKNAIKIITRNEAISEEMRILYVALTRAKEKLIITGTVNNYEKNISKKQEEVEMYNDDNNKISTMLLKKYISYLDWIDLVYLSNNSLKKEFEYNVYNKKDIKIDEERTDTLNLINLDCDVNFEEIEEKLEWKYKFEKETLLPIKSTVSKIKQMDNDNIEELFEEENNNQLELIVPNFIEKEKIGSAKKGTLMHLVLQNINFKEKYDLIKVKQLIDHLLFKNKITCEERKVIDEEKIVHFCNSNLFKQISKAKEVYKEIPFCTKVKAKDYFDSEEDTFLLVQGIIDLYFVDEDGKIIIVDYKTDIEKDENILKNRYKKQLEIYKNALEKNSNQKVFKKYIFSMFLNKEIEC